MCFCCCSLILSRVLFACVCSLLACLLAELGVAPLAALAILQQLKSPTAAEEQKEAVAGGGGGGAAGAAIGEHKTSESAKGDFGSAAAAAAAGAGAASAAAGSTPATPAPAMGSLMSPVKISASYQCKRKQNEHASFGSLTIDRQATSDAAALTRVRPFCLVSSLPALFAPSRRERPRFDASSPGNEAHSFSVRVARYDVWRRSARRTDHRILRHPRLYVAALSTNHTQPSSRQLQSAKRGNHFAMNEHSCSLAIAAALLRLCLCVCAGGKTQLCMQLCCNVQISKRLGGAWEGEAIYIG